jgi:hypothetical protein
LEIFSDDEKHPTYEIAKIYLLNKLDHEKEIISGMISELELMTEDKFFDYQQEKREKADEEIKFS